MAQTEALAGGWTPFGPITPESKKVFDEAMEGLVGVHYTPQKVSTQVVKGMNYRFLCDAQVVGIGEPYRALVQIYQPLGGQKPILTGIVRLDGDAGEAAIAGGQALVAGGWSEFGPPTRHDLFVFGEAMFGWTGVGYKPLEVARQIVAGTHYRFFCNATTVTQHPIHFAAMVTIEAPLQGKPQVVHIERC